MGDPLPGRHHGQLIVDVLLINGAPPVKVAESRSTQETFLRADHGPKASNCPAGVRDTGDLPAGLMSFRRLFRWSANAERKIHRRGGPRSARLYYGGRSLITAASVG